MKMCHSHNIKPDQVLLIFILYFRLCKNFFFILLVNTLERNFARKGKRFFIDFIKIPEDSIDCR